MTATTMLLPGCRTSPLGSYLKALGAFRVLAEQLDQRATAYWQGDVLGLRSQVGREEVEDFFLDVYQPTPVVSPWNNSSGFDGKTTPEVEAIIASETPRLEAYRETIDVALALSAKARVDQVDKQGLLLRCRAQLPDPALTWLDAALVLTDDGAAYPPLLGTGGNLGRLELSRNFMAHVATVLRLNAGRRGPTAADVRAWLRAGLFDQGDPALVKASIAQFDPGPAGGANMAPTGKAESVVNPWDFVLLVEGALLFASAAARRMGSAGGGTASIPFTTSASPVGYGSSAAEEPSRGELWTPVWTRRVTLTELAHLLGEGRAEWRRRQARNGVDFARAVAALGTDRGVDRFVRHAFVERLGQMSLAVPVGVVAVRERPEVRVLEQVDPWLERVRRGRDAPAGVVRGLRRVDAAMYAVATGAGAGHLQRVLSALAEVERAVERASTFRARTGIRPLSGLAAGEWLSRLDDGTDEFAVAVSLASGRDRNGQGLRTFLTGVVPDRGRLDWAQRPAPVPGLGSGRIEVVLAEAFAHLAVRRSRESRSPPASLDHVGFGVSLAFDEQHQVALPAVLRLAQGELDPERLAPLLEGLLLLDFASSDDVERSVKIPSPVPVVAPSVAALLPCCHHLPLAHRRRRVLLRAEPTWPRQLAAGHAAAVVAASCRRLRLAGFDVPPLNAERAAAVTPAPWLAVAALCRLTTADVRRLLDTIDPPTPE